MATVTFSLASGGDGSTVTDDSDATTGLDNYGYTTRFVPALTQVVNIGANATAQATAAAASAASALNAPGTNATSTTSVAVGSGSKSFTIQTGKAYVVGQTLNVASAADPANYMAGPVTAYTTATGALVVNVTQTGGSGTKTDWVVSMGAIVSSTLPSQTGNANKSLMTDGTTASWVTMLRASNNLSDIVTAATARTNLGLGSIATLSTINGGNWSGTDLAVADGGTGASTAAGARTNLAAAASGANSDITSLTALSTALSLAQGGTGGTTAALARTNLALGTIATQASSAVAITGGTISGITDLTVADGGTGSSSAAGARGNLAAAASGANSDITSLTALSTALTVAQGGTGGTTAGTALSTLLGAYTANKGSGVQVNEGETAVVYVRRAKVKWTMSGSSIASQTGRNAVVTRTGTGAFTITFDNAFSDSDYIVLGTARRAATSEAIGLAGSRLTSNTASACYVSVVSYGGSVEDPAQAWVYVEEI